MSFSMYDVSVVDAFAFVCSPSSFQFRKESHISVNEEAALALAVDAPVGHDAVP